MEQRYKRIKYFQSRLVFVPCAWNEKVPTRTPVSRRADPHAKNGNFHVFFSKTLIADATLPTTTQINVGTVAAHR